MAAYPCVVVAWLNPRRIVAISALPAPGTCSGSTGISTGSAARPIFCKHRRLALGLPVRWWREALVRELGSGARTPAIFKL